MLLEPVKQLSVFSFSQSSFVDKVLGED